MTERCINLTAAEARAWAAGATALIRPVNSRDGGHPDIHDMKWRDGDVLIGREAWARAWSKELLPGERIGKTAAQCAADNGGFSCAVCDGVVYRADSPAHDDPRCWWRSAATMPKALARHRYPVLSVHVSLGRNVSFEQAAAAIGHEVRTATERRTALRYLGIDTGDNYVSVTMLDRSKT